MSPKFVLGNVPKVFLSVTPLSLPHSESPYSEPGAFEEGEQDGGTETQTSEEGRSPNASMQRLQEFTLGGF